MERKMRRFRQILSAEDVVRILSEQTNGVLLCEKYSPGVDSDTEIAKCLGHVSVMRLDIARMTGKEAIELVRERQ